MPLPRSIANLCVRCTYTVKGKSISSEITSKIKPAEYLHEPNHSMFNERKNIGAVEEREREEI